MSKTEQHENIEEHGVDVGDQFRYYQLNNTKDLLLKYLRRYDVALHSILYTWQIQVAKFDDEWICVDEAEANIVYVNLTSLEYDLGNVRFKYPARMYGYPEIYKPYDLVAQAYSYTRRLFDPEADVW